MMQCDHVGPIDRLQVSARKVWLSSTSIHPRLLCRSTDEQPNRIDDGPGEQKGRGVKIYRLIAVDRPS